MWCFVSGDGPGLRDFVIRHGVVKPLLKFVNPNVPVSFVCWYSEIQISKTLDFSKNPITQT